MRLPSTDVKYTATSLRRENFNKHYWEIALFRCSIDLYAGVFISQRKIVLPCLERRKEKGNFSEPLTPITF